MYLHMHLSLTHCHTVSILFQTDTASYIGGVFQPKVGKEPQAPGDNFIILINGILSKFS